MKSDSGQVLTRCSSDNEYEVTATLTGCNDEEFTCRKNISDKTFKFYILKINLDL